jgi:FKBP-type peptidyl-prolyl cis-trans isomerase SlyD
MSDNKEKVGDGKFVAYSYTLTDVATGNVLFEATEDAPDVMVYGLSQDVVPGLIAAVKGLGLGDKFEVTLPSAAAFGERSEEWVKHLPKSIFLQGGNEWPSEVTVGAMVPMMTEQGFPIHGLVKEINADEVIMDFNHPFAGMDVRYEGKIIEVRDATEEELRPQHGCGCGSCGGGCGDDGCGGCGDNGCGCN